MQAHVQSLGEWFLARYDPSMETVLPMRATMDEPSDDRVYGVFRRFMEDPTTAGTRAGLRLTRDAVPHINVGVRFAMHLGKALADAKVRVGFGALDELPHIRPPTDDLGDAHGWMLDATHHGLPWYFQFTKSVLGVFAHTHPWVTCPVCDTACKLARDMDKMCMVRCKECGVFYSAFHPHANLRFEGISKKKRA
jgi:hypothetical protein